MKCFAYHFPEEKKVQVFFFSVFCKKRTLIPIFLKYVAGKNVCILLETLESMDPSSTALYRLQSYISIKKVDVCLCECGSRFWGICRQADGVGWGVLVVLSWGCSVGCGLGWILDGVGFQTV